MGKEQLPQIKSRKCTEQKIICPHKSKGTMTKWQTPTGPQQICGHIPTLSCSEQHLLRAKLREVPFWLSFPNLWFPQQPVLYRRALSWLGFRKEHGADPADISPGWGGVDQGRIHFLLSIWMNTMEIWELQGPPWPQTVKRRSLAAQKEADAWRKTYGWKKCPPGFSAAFHSQFSSFPGSDCLPNLGSMSYWCIHIINSLFKAAYTFPLFTKLQTIQIKGDFRTSLVAQWLRIHLPTQGTQFLSPVWEDTTCPGATNPLCHNYWACSRARAPQQGKPLQEAWAPQQRVAARESPSPAAKTQCSQK